MKKVYKILNLDCAACALKLEEAIKKTDGVENAKINFLTQKLTLEADEKSFDRIFKNVLKISNKIEPDCEII